MGRINGETVSVELLKRGARDSFGNDTKGWEKPQDVANVLIVPGKCEELDATRPEGVRVALTLHFPKTFTSCLRGAKVTLTGRWAGTYNVIGDPKPYQDANTPNDWDMPVEVEAVDG
jgi:hypothetical protein